jgi:Domain of unknown function (DUF4112)
MTRFIDALRSRWSRLPPQFERHALWLRTRAFLAALWHPPRAADVMLPPWLHVLVGISDDGLQIPGTRVRLGLDAVLGTLLPGAGDALGGVTSATLMYVAWRRGAPRQLLFEMLKNAAMDIGIGTIPVVGDIFDLGFHANRRNITLLEDHLRSKTRAQAASKASAALVFALLGLLILLVIGAMVGLGVVLWRHLR